MKQTLTQHVDAEDLPQVYGGNLDWEYGMHPNMDEECQRTVGQQLASQWVEGPLRLIADESGDGAVIVSTGEDARNKSRQKVLSKITGRRASSDEDSE